MLTYEKYIKLPLIERVKTPLNLRPESSKDIFNNPIQKYKLMLKQHFDTGLNYLCVTTKENYKKYKGSGSRWKKLINKNPSEIKTTLIFTTDDFDLFCSVCTYYSHLFDVPSNDIFMNIIHENGPVIPDQDEVMKYVGKLGGNIIKSKKLGIFGASSELKSKWAKENGSKGGIKNRDNNLGLFSLSKEEKIENSRKGGSVGGLIVGKMPWWTDGTINKKSHNRPGPTFYRGMTKKIKPIPPHLKNKNKGN